MSEVQLSPGKGVQYESGTPVKSTAPKDPAAMRGIPTRAGRTQHLTRTRGHLLYLVKGIHENPQLTPDIVVKEYMLFPLGFNIGPRQCIKTVDKNKK